MADVNAPFPWLLLLYGGLWLVILRWVVSWPNPEQRRQRRVQRADRRRRG